MLTIPTPCAKVVLSLMLIISIFIWYNRAMMDFSLWGSNCGTQEEAWAELEQYELRGTLWS